MEDKQELAQKAGDLGFFAQQVGYWITEQLLAFGFDVFYANLIRGIILFVIMILISWVAYFVVKRYVVVSIHKVLRKTKSHYDDYLIKHKVFEKLSRLIPALIIWFYVDVIFSNLSVVGNYATNLVIVYMVFIIVSSFSAFMKAVDDIYNTFSFARERPIKGYIQVVLIVVYSIAVLISISVVFDKEMTTLFTGLGAIAAIILLIFKDTILGLVAGIQLTANNMVKIGDWISMPSHNTDGTVLEITLNTVKVQNWDKTISTVPTYALVTNSFSNWRGMEESGGRRIKRDVSIDMQSVKFCDDKMISKFKKIAFLQKYIDTKSMELVEYNKVNHVDDSVLVNGRRMTNLGVFRKYLEEYLTYHPKINNDMTFLVRHLQPTEKGIPIEIYVFSKDQEWANYEAIQADIFDHILAVLPEFELSVFQFPAGSDLKKLN